MDLQSVTKVNIDFHNKNHVMINAKQYDKQSRYILFSCYNKNEFIHIDKTAYTAFIRYKKADDYGVFNLCTITDDGRVLAGLTEQMLAVSGLCRADLIIAKGRSLTFNPDNGSIMGATNPNILSTMTFYVDVSETPIENSEIESSYDYSGFNEALEAIKDDISDVVTIAKSYSEGGTNRRPNEDTDNAKYYYEQCRDKEDGISENAANAAKSESNAKAYMESAKANEASTKAYKDNAYTYMNNAEGYMNNAKASETNAKTSASNAKTSETNAKTSETNAKEYKNESYNYSIVAQRYAVGGTNTVNGEDADNAKYYYEQCLISESNTLASEQKASASEANALTSEANAKTSEINALSSEQKAYESEQSAAQSKSDAFDSATSASNSEIAASGYAVTARTSATNAVNSATEAQTYYLQTEAIANSLNGAFLPMGTITYEELASLKESGTVGTGYLYNISDNFTTDNTFKMGAGIECSAGTNVYYTADGYWDCFAGTTVAGVKGDKETNYRIGNVNITADNVGAIPSADIATVDEIKTYLSIS